MAGTKVDVTTGASIVFGTSGFTAEITALNIGGIERPSIGTSHLGTAAPGANQMANMTFIPGDLSDPGELSLEIHFDPDTIPPIDAVTEVITITWPLASGDTTAATWSASGFMTSLDMTGPLEDKMTANVTVKFTGNITRTVAA